MSRTGMSDLITHLRQMTEAGTEDYTLAGVTYWSDDDLQAELDQVRRRHTDILLRPRPENVGGTSIYTRYEMPWDDDIRHVEGTGGGTAVFRVHDSTGTTIEASAYEFQNNDLSVTFDADTEGSARYWSGYSYDLRKAAQEIWLRKAAHAYKAINFSADGARFDREAIHAHCMEMAKIFGYQRGLRSGRMVRTDLAGRDRGADGF